MADIISYNRILRGEREKKQAQILKRKAAAVRKTFQTAYRNRRCERCGEEVSQQGPLKTTEHQGHRVPYRFCEVCAEEYVDYILRLQGGGNRSFYWHNDAWSQLWRQWIDFHSAVDNYLKSKEFRQLLEEVQKS